MTIQFKNYEGTYNLSVFFFNAVFCVLMFWKLLFEVVAVVPLASLVYSPMFVTINLWT